MLSIISGDIGDGKSLYLTYKAFQTGLNVVANFKLFGIPFTYFSIVDYLNNEYSNSLILLDEIYNYIDSRNSMSKLNKTVSYKTFQSRKKGLHIIGAVQLMSSADLRFKELCNNYIRALGVVKSGGKYYYQYRLVHRKHKKLITKSFYLPMKMARFLYDYYDTYEVVELGNHEDIVLPYQTRDEQIEYVDNIIKGLLEKYDNAKDITHDKVRNYMFRNGKNVQLEPYVYEQLKEILEEREVK